MTKIFAVLTAAGIALTSSLALAAGDVAPVAPQQPAKPAVAAPTAPVAQAQTPTQTPAGKTDDKGGAQVKQNEVKKDDKKS